MVLTVEKPGEYDPKQVMKINLTSDAMCVPPAFPPEVMTRHVNSLVFFSKPEKIYLMRKKCMLDKLSLEDFILD